MKPTIALIAWAFLASGMSVKAAPPRNFGNGGLPEFLKPYDTNKDGVLSAEEREAARKGRADRAKSALEKWDTNGDGKLSPVEIEAARKAARAEIDAIRTKRFNDADKDLEGTPGYGLLSLEEFTASVPTGTPAAMITRLFTFLDADKDSQLSLAEFLTACPQPPPPPPLPPVVSLPFFRAVDTNQNKIISPEEFAAFLKIVRPAQTADEVAAMFAKLDTNSDNGITPDEWPVKDPGTPPLPPAPLPLPAFGVVDKNKDTFVDPMEFSMAACASHIPALRARDMYRKADLDANGKLTQTEYEAIPALPPTTP